MKHNNPSTKCNEIAKGTRTNADKSRKSVPQATPKGDQRQGAGPLLDKKANVVRGSGSA